MMKKSTKLFAAALLCLVLLFSACLTSCGENVEPTSAPTDAPTTAPTVEKTDEPTASESESAPTEPTDAMTEAVTDEPTASESESATDSTDAMTETVTAEPTDEPTEELTEENGLFFRTFVFEGDEAYLSLPNKTESFSFLDEIEMKGEMKYAVALDIHGMQTALTKTVSLAVGDNTFYIMELLDDEVKNIYTVTIRRRPMYTVTFDTKDGTPLESQIIEEGALVTVPTVEREGYTFASWSRDLTLPITEDTVISAEWMGNSYTVSYDANGGTVDHASSSVVMGASYELTIPAKIGYTFMGWYNGAERINASGTWGLASDVAVKAEWMPNTNTPYTVEHYIEKLDGTHELRDTDILTGTSDSQVTPSVKTYEGFAAPDVQTATVATDGSLVVRYEYTRNSYTVTFITNGGNEIESETLKYQEEVNLCDAVRNEYTFGGWFSNSQLTELVTAMPASDIIVYAYWTEENKPNDFSYAGTRTITINDYKANDTTVCIPSYIGGVPVTEIDDSVFENCNTLVSVTIPDSVTSIGEDAFSGCSGLTSIEIPASVTNIGFYAFSGCTGLASIEIPANVTSIGSGAFKNCSGLTSMTIPFVGENKDGTGETYFEYIFGAYSDLENSSCVPTSLKEVIITGGTSIKSLAFSECTSLTSIKFSSSVTSIGSYAFYLCYSLKSIEIPDGVTSIGKGAFFLCDSLTNIEIAASVTSIDKDAFEECNNLTTVYYGGTASDWESISIDSSGNSKLTSAIRYYYSENEPTTSGNYWHYVDGVPTKWEN